MSIGKSMGGVTVGTEGRWEWSVLCKGGRSRLASPATSPVDHSGSAGPRLRAQGLLHSGTPVSHPALSPGVPPGHPGRSR